MHSITITLGRNIDGAPMPSEKWTQFAEDVTADLLAAVPSDITETHYGTGVWDGIPEDSCKVTVLRHSEPTAAMLDDLRRYMSENARVYDQDAIAITIGKSELA